MAQNEGGADAAENIELETHIFQAGITPEQAEREFLGLLSEDPDMDPDAMFSKTEDERGDVVSEDEEAGSESRQPKRDQQDDDAEEVDDSDEDDWFEEDDDLLDDEEDEEEDDDLEEDGEPDESLYTVKVDGEEKQVSLQELKDGFSFRTHNTQTAQRLAEERKALEAEAAQVRDERTRYRSGLERLATLLGDEAPDEPDWDKLEREDPSKFATEYAKFQRRQKQQEALREEQDRVARAEAEDALNQMVVRRDEEAEKLLEALPDWRDPTRMEKEQVAISRGAQEYYGFTADELDTVIDHRTVLMLRDAVRYRKQIAKGKAAIAGKKKPQRRRKMKPGGTGSTRKTPRRSSRRRSQTSGPMDMRQGEAAIFDMLDEDDL